MSVSPGRRCADLTPRQFRLLRYVVAPKLSGRPGAGVAYWLQADPPDMPDPELFVAVVGNVGCGGLWSKEAVPLSARLDASIVEVVARPTVTEREAYAERDHPGIRRRPPTPGSRTLNTSTRLVRAAGSANPGTPAPRNTVGAAGGQVLRAHSPRIRTHKKFVVPSPSAAVSGDTVN